MCSSEAGLGQVVLRGYPLANRRLRSAQHANWSFNSFFARFRFTSHHKRENGQEWW